jgi:hypothetical protein
LIGPPPLRTNCSLGRKAGRNSKVFLLTTRTESPGWWVNHGLAMLHDLTLVKEFDNYALPFEKAGGHVA